MSNSVALDEPLLTPADLRRRVEDYRRVEQEIADRTIELDRIGGWIESVIGFLGEDRVRSIVGELPNRKETDRSTQTRNGRNGRQTFTSFIEAYVTEQARGVGYRELREAILASPLRETMERTDKTFHSAIGKLVESDRVVRHNQRLFCRDALKEHLRKVDEGTAVDAPPESARNRVSPMSAAIVRFVEDHHDGVASRDVLAHVASIDQFAALVERNSTNVYNTLSRMVRQGRLRKEGTTYFPGVGDNENSGSR